MQKNYVCTWTLPVGARELAKNGTSSERAAAKTLLANYSQLAEVIVLGPEGELIDHRDMNDILERFPAAVGNWEGDLRTTQYFLSFLQESAMHAMKPALSEK